MPMYTVRQGDYLSKIAHEHGFSDWRVIYDHAQNESFRQRRPNPNIIFPGDEIFIPDLEEKEQECSTGQVHRFRVNQGSNSLHVILKDTHGEPIRNTAYVLHMAGQDVEGQTDDTGAVRQEQIPPNLDEATLDIAGHTLTLKIGHLDPLEAEDEGASGVQARLRNLGYYGGEITGSIDDETRQAIRSFQEVHGLEQDGSLSTALKDKLRELHGC